MKSRHELLTGSHEFTSCKLQRQYSSLHIIYTYIQVFFLSLADDPPAYRDGDKHDVFRLRFAVFIMQQHKNG